MDRSVRLRSGITACVLGAAVAFGAAPTASAADDLAVSGGFGLGFVQYGTGCTYTVTTVGTPPGALTDQVAGGAGGGTFGPVDEPKPGIFTADWNPSVTGRHLLSAASGATNEVNVAIGYDFGLICATLPEGLRLPF